MSCNPERLEAVAGQRSVPGIAVAPGEPVRAVEKSLPILRRVAAIVSVYGPAETAGDLQHAISLLEAASPVLEGPGDGLDFHVNRQFLVPRARVADLLLFGFEGNNWHKLVDFSPPHELRFRAEPDRVVPPLDYPLNPGGSVSIFTAKPKEGLSRLDLGLIARGLDILATKYPRHFADFLMGTEDYLTGNVFLECCLFGESAYE